MADQGDDEPLAVELATLRAAVAQFQQEAHSTALRLQHHFVANANVLERNKSLEKENVRLRKELAVLRANPVTPPQSAGIQVQELTLALRRVSDQISFTEQALLACKLELANARSDLVKTKHATASAYALAAAARGREEESLIRENNLRHQLRLAEQDRKMSDLVIHEYADLVRSIESRTSNSRGDPVNNASSSYSSSADTSSTTLVDNLAESKSDVQKLFESFKAESADLEREIARLQQESRLCQSQLASEREGSAHDRSELAKALTELERLRIDDNTAAKMVSRYMKFSQSTATSLQSSLTALTSRHAATQATFLAELEDVRALLVRENQDVTRLRGALDELSADFAREAYGRRREVALRLALLCREERLCERLRRWVLRSRELAGTCDSCECHSSHVLEDVLNGALHILCAVDGEEGASFQSSGQLSRMIVAQGAVSMLTEELTNETERRLILERARVQGMTTVDDPGIASQPDDVHQQPKETPAEMSEYSSNDGANLDQSITLDLPGSLKSQHQTVHTHPTSSHEPEIEKPDKQSPRPVLSPSETDSHSDGPEQLVVERNLLDPTLIISPCVDNAPAVQSHPLLADLARVGERYSDLQRAFRDCHLALQSLRSSLSPTPSPKTTSQFSGITPVLQAAVERLFHYTEDARVELEIRAADELLLARGFEALLSIPGAISPSPSSPGTPRFEHRHTATASLINTSQYSLRTSSLSDVENDIQAFVDGTEPSVQKALQGFNSRLEDIQHDIAVIKLASHDLQFSGVAEDQIETLRIAGILDVDDSVHTKQAVTSSDDPTIRNDPFAQLGLRIPMPRYVHRPSKRQIGHPRKSSGMHMLGLGLPYGVSDTDEPGKVNRAWSGVSWQTSDDTSGTEGTTQGHTEVE